jgi:hypothetical protein
MGKELWSRGQNRGEGGLPDESLTVFPHYFFAVGETAVSREATESLMRLKALKGHELVEPRA